MKTGKGTAWVVGFIMAVGMAEAQTKEVTVQYLRAAVGSLSESSRVVLRAEYDASTGLQEATETPLRGKGYSRFNVRDPETGVVFDAMYCELDSKAFDTLLTTDENKVFVFTGKRGRGERREPAVIVTEARAVPARDTAADDAPVLPENPRTFTLTVTDRTTSNTTIIANVELGKPYSILGSTLLIEEQPQDSGVTVIEP